MTRLYGYKADPIDPRDRPAARLLAALPAPPTHASLRNRAPHALNQGRSDCVAHAVAAALQIALSPSSKLAAALPSRDWIYYLSGVPEGIQRNDNGRYIREAFTVLSHLGWPDETAWPYGQWPKHPGGEPHRLAFDRRAAIGVAYHRVTETGTARIDACKRLIAAGYPIVGGLNVTQAFEDQNGLTPEPAPKPGELVLGGHAICFAEYDPDSIVFLNSWSAAWAANGWGRLAWEWMTLATTNDLWAVEIVPAAKAVQS